MGTLYIGKTGRILDIRLKQHKHAFKADTLNSKSFVHALEIYHIPNFGNDNVIKSLCNSYASRVFHEGLYTKLGAAIEILKARGQVL